MDRISYLVKTTIPNYISNLPLPNSSTGWSKLSISDWASLIPPTAMLVGVGYTCYRAYCPAALRRCNTRTRRVNRKIRMEERKVIDMIDIENIAKKAAFCRCWNSKNWPYCDGSHGAHNKKSCDNLGPLVIKRKSA